MRAVGCSYRDKTMHNEAKPYASGKDYTFLGLELQ